MKMSNPDHETEFSLEEGERCYQVSITRLNFYHRIFRIYCVNFTWMAAFVASVSFLGFQSTSDPPGIMLQKFILIFVLFFPIAFIVYLGIHFFKGFVKTVLILGDDSMISRNRTDQKICYDEIESAEWDPIPLITIRTATGELKIEIRDFPEDQQAEIVNLLHEAINPDDQEYWDQFEASFKAGFDYDPEILFGKFSYSPIRYESLYLGLILVFSYLSWLDLGSIWIFHLMDIFGILALVFVFSFLWSFPSLWRAIRQYRETQKEKGSVSG